MTATIGNFDCKTGTIPVTIDNSEVVGTPYVEVSAIVGDDDEPSWDFYDDGGVDSGAIRVVQVGPIPRSIHGPVQVYVGTEPQTYLDDGDLAERDVHIDCPSAAVASTVATTSAKPSQTGGFNLALPLLGVALLTGAGIFALSRRRARH
jgi:LPXTG-motif cell wall-anchored protein